MSVHALHCTHVKSHLTLRKKSRPLWPVMIDDSAHERRKLVKTYQNVLPQKRTVVAEVCKETYSNKCDKME